MNFPKSILVSDFVKKYMSKSQAAIEGNLNAYIRGISLVHLPREGTLCFAEDRKVLEILINSKCSAIILRPQLAQQFSRRNIQSKGLILVDNPSKVFHEVLSSIAPQEFQDWNFSEEKSAGEMALLSAVSPSAKIGSGTVIYPGAFIGSKVVIGSNCIIHTGARILGRSLLGNNIYIGPNSIVGARPNWVFLDNGRLHEFEGIGRVIIKNNVIIGANSVIERGLVFNTKIGRNCVVGNGSQIGHDCFLEENILVAGQAGIAGGCHVGSSTRVYAQSGIAQNLHIAARTIVSGKSAVMSDVKEEGLELIGIPAIEKKLYSKRQSATNQLPRILEEGKNLFKLPGKTHEILGVIISDQLGIPIEKIRMDFDLKNDGRADSLDITEIIMEVEQEFEIEFDDETTKKITSVRSLYKEICKQLPIDKK